MNLTRRQFVAGAAAGLPVLAVAEVPSAQVPAPSSQADVEEVRKALNKFLRPMGVIVAGDSPLVVEVKPNAGDPFGQWGNISMDIRQLPTRAKGGEPL